MRLAGFTLIELLITIAIMSLAMGLVGPLAIEQLDKFKAQDELVKLEKIINNEKRIAFVNRHHTLVNLSKSSLTVTRVIPPASYSKKYDFKFLRFNPQQIAINRNGFYDITELEVSYADSVKQLKFSNQGVY